MRKASFGCLFAFLASALSLIAGSTVFRSDRNIVEAVVTDLNSDGLTDVAVLTASSGHDRETRLELFFARTAGLPEHPSRSIPVIAYTLRHVQLGDTHYLIVTTNRQTTLIYTSADGFAKPFSTMSANQWSALCHLHLHSSTNTCDIFHGPCIRRFSPPDRITHGYVYDPPKNKLVCITTSDLNVDGHQDIIATASVPPYLRLYYGPFPKNLQIKPKDLTDYVPLAPEQPLVPMLAIGDLNQDARPDIVAVSSQHTYVFLQNAPVGFTNLTKPSLRLPYAGIPIIRNNRLLSMDRRTGLLSIFAPGKLTATPQNVDVNLKNILGFRHENGQYLLFNLRF